MGVANDKPPSPTFTYRKALNLLGVLVLLFGLGSAVNIYRRGQENAKNQEMSEDEDSTLSPVDSKRLSRDMEMNWGKLGLLTEKAFLLADEWKKPKPLAITVGAMSILIGGGCFLAARWVSR